VSTIGVVVITKNEEAQLARCLDSVKPFADEIIVIDDASTDNTAKIAQRYGAKVFINESKGNFDMQRNIGIEQSSCEWILQLDADEVLPAATAGKILERIKHPGRYAAFNLKRKNFFLGKPILNAGNYHNKTYLFCKDKGRYIGSIHETLKVDGETGFIEAEVFHYPFNSIGSFIDRQNYYSETEANVFLKKNRTPSKKYIKYQLTWKSIKNFYKLYVKKSGYKDGIHGLIWCLLNVIHTQLFWMKIWEKAYKEDKP